MAKKISVFHPDDLKHPRWGIKRFIAEQLVSEKKAIGNSPRRGAITLLPFASNSPLVCRQERVYEQIGIEKFPRLVSGGLTRTEIQPALIDRFKGARVGH